MVDTNPNPLCWIDLETTSTNEDTGLILEVGVAITEATPPFEVLDTFSAVVRYPDRPIDRIREMMPPEVQTMHDASGLWAEITARHGTDLWKTERLVIDLVRRHIPKRGNGAKGNLMVAGSGVSHFDRRWIRRHMPTLESYLDYPMLDVGVLRRTWRLVLGDAAPDHSGHGGGTRHRALDDVADHLEEFRRYAVEIQGEDRRRAPKPSKSGAVTSTPSTTAQP